MLAVGLHAVVEVAFVNINGLLTTPYNLDIFSWVLSSQAVECEQNPHVEVIIKMATRAERIARRAQNVLEIKKLEEAAKKRPLTRQECILGRRLHLARGVRKLSKELKQQLYTSSVAAEADNPVPPRHRRKRKKTVLEILTAEPKKRGRPQSFYNTQEWRELSYTFKVAHRSRCWCCGRSPQIHGISIHTDHIKSVKRYPELRLDWSNLQLLCRDCNLGKGSVDETRWAPFDETKMPVDDLIPIDEDGY